MQTGIADHQEKVGGWVIDMVDGQNGALDSPIDRRTNRARKMNMVGSEIAEQFIFIGHFGLLRAGYYHISIKKINRY